MTKATASDIVRAVLELCESNGGKATLREVVSSLERELGAPGVLAVTLTTPSGDAGEAGKRIVAAIEKKTGRTVSLSQKADPALIGGMIVQFADERVDLSVRGALSQFEQSLQS